MSDLRFGICLIAIGLLCVMVLIQLIMHEKRFKKLEEQLNNK